MEFGCGVLDAEAPVDSDLSPIFLLFQDVNLPTQGLLVGDTLLEAAAGKDGKFDLRHPLVKLRTGLSQLPCLGMSWNSSRSAIRSATAAGRRLRHREVGPLGRSNTAHLYYGRDSSQRMRLPSILYPSTCWMVQRLTSRRLASSRWLTPLDRSSRMYCRCCPVRTGRRPGKRPSVRAFA